MEFNKSCNPTDSLSGWLLTIEISNTAFDLETFGFLKLVAEERWSQPEVRLYTYAQLAQVFLSLSHHL